MHISPTPLNCALGIIHDAELHELVAIKDIITTSLLADIKANPKRPPTGDADLDYVRNAVDELVIKQLTEDRVRMLKRIVSRQENAGKSAGGITDDMIARAKEAPIEEVFTTLVGTPIRNGMASCPWHDDHSASFSMRRYNRFRCFSCEEKGSVIDLYMKVNNVGFSQAVRGLCKMC